MRKSPYLCNRNKGVKSTTRNGLTNPKVAHDTDEVQETMKYLAKATHVKHVITMLKPTAVFKTDEHDIWYEASTEAEANEVEHANKCIEESLRRRGML